MSSAAIMRGKQKNGPTNWFAFSGSDAIMITAAGILIVFLALLVHVQVLFLLAQVLGSLSSFPRSTEKHWGSRPRVCILIPAHNESFSIRRTISAVKAQLTEGDRIIVVADNCSDDTAQIATDEGAEVTKRDDSLRLGKGYALDHGVRFVGRTGPPEVIILVDADCELGPGSVDALSRLSQASQRPVQAKNLQMGAAGGDQYSRIQEFAVIVTNYVRPLGASRLGLPCRLSGTGMGFPWPIIAAMELSTGNITEDIKLGADLAIAGHEPLFCPEASVTSSSPASLEGQRAQRMRWEHGHLALIIEYVPRLIWTSFKKRRSSLLFLALDMSIPPLGLLVLLMVVLASASVIVTVGGYPAWAIIVTTSTLGTFGWAVWLAWYRYGRTVVSARDLLSAPLYAFSKFPMLWRFITKRQMTWVRSERDED